MIPKELDTLGKLFVSAGTFSPFEPMEFIPGGTPLPPAEDYKLMQYLAGPPRFAETLGLLARGFASRSK
jgi:hypothetical protein